MWHNSKLVQYVYAHVNTQYAYAIIEGLSGWKRIDPVSTDGVTNVLDILTTAKANGIRVNVYLTADEKIQAAYMA